MEETSIREHFIPFRKADLVRMCATDPGLPDASRVAFEQLATMLAAIFHFEFHARLERLKDLYAPVNPDRDTLPNPLPDKNESTSEDSSLVDELQTVLQAANFVAITQEDLQRALLEESLFNVRLEVNFSDFEEVVFFRRGESTRKETIRKWFGLRERAIEFTNYDRVLVYVRFKDADYFATQKRGALMFTPGSTLLKLFQDVPKADLEMLFPNTEVRMKLLDKILIGVPAAAGSIAVVATKLSGTLLLVGAFLAFWLGMRSQPVTIDQAALITLAVGLGTLAGYLFRQFTKFKNRKIQFMKALTDNLYFRNLDNNAGVFHRLIDSAEEEECKESLLAYHALLCAGRPLSELELDRQVEQWFLDRWQCSLDFEADDALRKLVRLQLVDQAGEKYSAVAPAVALRRLDQRWDAFFQFD